MGAVYLGEHVGLHKPVAVKLLHAELAGRDDLLKRFQREAQAAAAIRHQNIVEVFDVGITARGEPYIVMEYLEGKSQGEDQQAPLSRCLAFGARRPARQGQGRGQEDPRPQRQERGAYFAGAAGGSSTGSTTGTVILRAKINFWALS
jgi:hypothetical protein